MGDSSPTSLMFGGMAITAMSLKLKQNYIYLSYAAVVLGLLMFVVGLIKFYKQRNRY